VSTPTTKKPSEAEAVARLLAAFPGSSVTNGRPLPEPEPNRVEGHARRLWGKQPGWVYLAWGTGPHWAAGVYRHAAWKPRWFHWPGQSAALAAAATRMAVDGDVYAGVLLRRTRTPATAVDGHSNLLPGRWCWADCDGEWTDQRQTWLDRLGDTTLVVDSGRGRHVYVRLNRPVDPDRLGELNRRLAAALEADHKWAPGTVLRLAGTFNWKTSPPGLVRKVR
jgi:hypothetical protein